MLDSSKMLVTALGVIAICFLLHKVAIYRLEAKHLEALNAAVNKVVASCEEQKAVTEEISHDYQTKLAGLNKRIADLNRLYRDTKVKLDNTGKTHGRNAAQIDKGLRIKDGVSVGDLLDYARDAEEVGIKLDSCQAFVNRSLLPPTRIR